MRKFFIILISAFSIGCSTIEAREDNGMGHPYISSEESIGNAVVLNAIAIKLFVFPLIFTLPLTIIDVSASLVADTILLPFDLFIEPENNYRETDSDWFCYFICLK